MRQIVFNKFLCLAKGVGNREACSWGDHRCTPTPATLSINQLLVCAASVFTQFCCTSPIALNTVADLSIISKRLEEPVPLCLEITCFSDYYCLVDKLYLTLLQPHGL